VERRSRRELRAALVALGIAAFVLLPAIVSFLRNNQIAAEVDRTARVLKERGASSIAGTTGDPLDSMADALDRVEDEASGFGIPGWFGPRAARELREPLRKAYLERIHTELRGRVARALEKELAGIGKAGHFEDSIYVAEDHTPLRTAYETVKLYATLVDPTDHVELPLAAQQLAGIWQRALPPGSDVDPQRVLRHATNYLVALPTEPALKWPPAPALRAAQDNLKKQGIRDLPYHWVLRHAWDQPPVRVSDVADNTSIQYLACPPDELVARHYTSSAWQKIGAVLDSRDSWPPEARIERWAIADQTVPTEEKVLREQVRRQYYEDYAKQWMAVLDKCTVNPPTTIGISRDELATLADTKGFYKRLFSLFAANTIADAKPSLLPIPLPLSTEGCAAKFSSAQAPDAALAAQAKTQSLVQKRFEPILTFSGDTDDPKKPEKPPLEKYFEILEELRNTLDGVTDAPGGPDPEPQFRRARQGVDRLIAGIEPPVNTQLSRLLRPPVEGTITVTKKKDEGNTSEEWEKKVWPVWSGKLHPLFPFSDTEEREKGSFEDFRSFFQPGGTLFGFVDAALANRVEATDVGYRAKPNENPPGDLLSCLTVAQEIKEAFFPTGEDPGMRLEVEADWQATDVTDAKFVIGEKATPLSRAQWSPVLKWNGEGARLEWSQGGVVNKKTGRAPFSLFDLFKRGGLTPSPGARQGTYEVSFPPLLVKVRSPSKRDPLRPGFFSRLRCPEHVVSGAP
jgi:type VI protein secretion system component VasK